MNSDKGIAVDTVTHRYTVSLGKLDMLARMVSGVYGTDAWREAGMLGVLEHCGRVDHKRMFQDMLQRTGMFAPDWRPVESSDEDEAFLEDLAGAFRNGQLIILEDDPNTGVVTYMNDGVVGKYGLYGYVQQAVFRSGGPAPAAADLMRGYTYMPSEEAVARLLDKAANLSDTDGYGLVTVDGVEFDIDKRVAHVTMSSVGEAGVELIRSLDRAVEEWAIGSGALVEDVSEPSVWDSGMVGNGERGKDVK